MTSWLVQLALTETTATHFERKYPFSDLIAPDQSIQWIYYHSKVHSITQKERDLFCGLWCIVESGSTPLQMSLN